MWPSPGFGNILQIKLRHGSGQLGKIADMFKCLLCYLYVNIYRMASNYNAGRAFADVWRSWRRRWLCNWSIQQVSLKASFLMMYSKNHWCWLVLVSTVDQMRGKNTDLCGNWNKRLTEQNKIATSMKKTLIQKPLWPNNTRWINSLRFAQKNNFLKTCITCLWFLMNV